MEKREQFFISYRWSDKGSDEAFGTVVHAIEDTLGPNAFWDVRSLRSGTFADVLRRKVADAYVFMPVVTERYLAFGAEGNREDNRDYCLMEYETAVLHGVKIVPLFLCSEGDKHTVGAEAAMAAARRTAEGQYDEADIAILKTHLLSQNGIQLSSLTEEALLACQDRLGTLVFDAFCTSDTVPYYRDVLTKQEARLNPIRIFGDFDDAGLTLDNSYIPLTFQRHYTRAEREQKERNRESTAPVDQPEAQLLSALAADRYAVVVGDAGQGKSSYVRHLAIDLGRNAQAYGLSRDKYFPLYLKCKQFNADALSDSDAFLGELAKGMEISRQALNTILRYGKPLFVFDAMDEVAPKQMDGLVAAVHTHLTAKHPNVYCLFTTRPGQKLVAAGDMTLDHTEATVVRRYTVKALDEAQRDAFVGRLAAAKGVEARIKDEFISKLNAKEQALTDYAAVSRNPFVLLTVFTDYDKGEDLPANRFDAILRVIDNTIARDLWKVQYANIESKDVIKVILGAVSYELYRQRDEGRPPLAKAQMPVELAKKLFGLDERDRKDRALLKDYRHFFERSKLFDNSGFRHEFLASTYAAYYLEYIMERRVKEGKDPLDVAVISSLSNDTDYWKSVTEALLCLLDRKSDDSKTYLEPILMKLQEPATPDYDTLCGAVSQFTRHQARGALALLDGMLHRGCEGILSGEQTDGGFVCPQGANPYEELFYYPAIYPALQPYLPNLPTAAEDSETAYVHNELCKEICALFGNDAQTALRSVYAERTSHPSAITIKFVEAAHRLVTFRTPENTRGFVRIPEGTGIRHEEFCDCRKLTSIFIPDTAPLIVEDYAFFGCSALTSITLPKSLIKIEKWAFSGCSGLTSLNLPAGVTYIEEYAFCDCNRLTSINIPKCITSIEEGVFSNCGLTSITIPEGVTSIGEYAFLNCSGLTSVTIPASVTSIGHIAFAGCSGLRSIAVSKDNPKYHSAGNCLIETETNALVLGCKSSAIPAYVTSIGSFAFDGCSGLTSITIPDSVVSIESGAFGGCSRLTSITVNTGNPTYHSEGNCLIETETKTLVLGCKTSVIPTDGSVTSIGNGAFRGCSELTSVNISDSVNAIGNGAFAGCSGLTSITIPASVTSIGEEAFHGCSGLTSITIPDSVTSIGSGAFDGCSELTAISLPNSVTSIGDCAFFECNNLFSIVIPDSVLSIGDNAFKYSGLTTINIGRNVSNIGNWAFSNCSRLASVTFVDGSQLTSIGDHAFSWCEKLTSINIPEGVTSIGDDAFCGCSGLSSIIIPSSIISIGHSVRLFGNRVFSRCSGLTSITIARGNPIYHCTGNCLIETKKKTLVLGCKTSVIPADGSVAAIGKWAFGGCAGLTAITIPDGVTSIGDDAFYDCSALTSITIPEGVTSIGNSAFHGCSELASITTKTIGSSVYNAFKQCGRLTSITIGSGVTSIDNRAFEGYSTLKSIYIPESVTSIGFHAFDGCSGLTSITIPKSVRCIWGAFANCSSLSSITVTAGNPIYHSAGNCLIETKTKTLILGCKTSVIPSDGSVTSIGVNAFANCCELTNISISRGVRFIGRNAFEGCEKLSSVTISDSVTSIGEGAFSRCSGLTSIDIPTNVTHIEEFAFNRCNQLSSICIPEGITFIGEGAFCSCSGLTSITVAKKNPAFHSKGNCLIVTKTKTLILGCKTSTIPKGLTSIGNGAFEGCLGLTNINIPKSVGSIGNHAFGGCSSLTSINIPKYVTSIGEGAFWSCSALTSITVAKHNPIYHGANNCLIDTESKMLIAGCKTGVIPADGSVISIRTGAFWGCNELTSINIPDSVTSIGRHAFIDCSRLTTIYFGGSMSQWYAIAKAKAWDEGVHHYVVHCTDGDIPK